MGHTPLGARTIRDGAVSGRGAADLAPPKLATLEWGRFLAATAVVFGHTGPNVDKLAAPGVGPVLGGWPVPGALGVTYFFVLSGFVMMMVHAGDWGDIAAVPRFWWRRLCRIYPAYWLALLIPFYFLHSLITPEAAIPMILLSPGHDREFIPAAWTLRHELVFYFFFGLALIPRLGPVVLAAWVFATFWRWIPWPVLDMLHLPRSVWLSQVANPWGMRAISYFNFYFMAGLAAGWIFVKFRPGRRTSLALAALGAALILVTLPDLAWGREYGGQVMFMRMAVQVGLLMLGLAGLERHGVLRGGRLARRAGALSYPLYVIHMPLLLALEITLPKLALSGPALLGALVAVLALIYLSAWLITALFDQPVQRLLRASEQWITSRLPGWAAVPQSRV
ncbi:acyltransferase family protein [Nitrospirillum pindoramense]|uniref:Peptidoglycan/LPS O-acetylase OafA/YrhL n=1 Tax=Nitrospirillum amazonense TaxID=28077 RepID=A0A560HI39_9PROT|nr:acyltransferase [Nitrospirillum amazonense]TWB46128.1 peptidoglycan/LPS O-acetylase OafA/YrhL [Nitrospirillum amazonense]